jgi:cytochrome P450
MYFFRPEFAKDLQSIIFYISERTLSGLPPSLWYFSPKYYLQREALAARERVAFAAKQFIEKRQMNSAEFEGTYLHAIIRAFEETNLGPEGLVSNIFDIFIAGTDNTAYAISWTLYCLLQYPTVLQAVRDEADKALEGGNISTVEERCYLLLFQLQTLCGLCE